MSRSILRTLAVTVVMVVGLAQARAAVVNLSTGLDGSNNLIATGGTPDAHWTYNDPNTVTNGPAQITTPTSADWFNPGPPPPNGPFYGWAANGITSDWIAINASTARNGNVNDSYEPNPGVPYSFSRTFLVTGPTVTLTDGAWGIDDEGTLSLNGHLISTLNNANASDPSNDWASLTPVAFPVSDLQAGLNTLTITMTYADNEFEAVRFQGTLSGDVSNVPEPTAIIVWSLLGGLGISIGWWRRRKAV